MKRVLLVTLVAVLGTLGGAAVAVARDAAAYQGRIYPGVSIAGIDVAGATRAQAAAAVQAIADARLARSIQVRIDSERIQLTYVELGFAAHVDEAVSEADAVGRTGPWVQRLRTRWTLGRDAVDIPVRYTRNARAIGKIIAPIARELTPTPQNAEVTVRGGKVVITRPSRTGRTLDVPATAARIDAALDSGAPEVKAVVATAVPEFTTEDAQELQQPLASYTTTMADIPNRTYNIALAAGFIRGIILKPGEVFSYNQIVGPRTAERGFKEAPVLLDDELVPGDGGGVCQVSSTLFNVALLADLEIVTRANHSRPVAYLPIGRDATVNYGLLDLAFRNTTGHHLMLWTSVVGRRLTITAYGTPALGKGVTITVSEREVIPPPAGTVTKKDPELEEGKVVTHDAQPGYRVKTYRIVKVQGQVRRIEQIGMSFYRPVPRTIKIGVKKGKQASVRP